MDIPNYTLRYSKKAKYLQLRLSRNGLELVIPEKRSFSSKIIEEFIHKKKAWIIKNWHGYMKSQEASHDSTVLLPSHIHLNAINQVWEVKYVATMGQKLKLVSNLSRQIILMGNISDIPSCSQLLKKWLKNVAQKILAEELRRVSKETGLLFEDVSVRNNLTRWGSCSSQQNISLCCNLLFLSYPLMRHVLLHELCHTKVMNHGPKFWQLFERFEPEAKTHAKRLRIAARELPHWVK